MSTILVVDDEASIREVVSMLLADEGYRVLEAEDGPPALDLIRREHPQLVLLDIMMPLMDGRDVLRRLRELPHGEATHVILMSAAVCPQVEDYRLAAFIPKPFDLELLLDTVRRLLGT